MSSDPEPASPEPKRAWRFAEGESARLTEEGALIVSNETLPFRVRDEGLPHRRPAFPGTPVRLGEAYYEVVASEIGEDSASYRLRPWPRDAVLRDPVVYDRRLIALVRRQRERDAVRTRSRRFAWALLPVVGFRLEDAQVRACDELGLDPRTASAASGALEAAFWVAAWLVLGPRWLPQSPLAPPLAGWLALFLLFPAAWRALCAIAFDEVSGSHLAWLADRATARFRTGRGHHDPRVLPLTRVAFWARLALPDRQQRQADGTLLVSGALPHLSWEPGRRVKSPEDDYWIVTPLAPTLERGRLVHRYQLAPERAHDEPAAHRHAPPSALHYHGEVLDGIAREWDDVLKAAAWAVSLLPEDVQHRAVGRRGGPAVLAAGAKATAVGEALCGAWLAAPLDGLNPFGLVSGAFLLYEAVRRFLSASRPDYAPSALGAAFSDRLRPERVAYEAHRDAERQVLTAPGAGAA